MFTVIMAGGSGTRFWPVSRRDKPKQFLSISSNDPMVVETCNRLNPLSKDSEKIIVLGREHIKEADQLFHGSEIKIVAEPIGRNTAPCIGLGAIFAQRFGCKNGPIAFLPADHFIGNPSSFLATLETAGKIAESGSIVTLGIIPTRPETGYGYIHRSGRYNEPTRFPVYKVSEFVEKPDLKTAEHYLTSGDYFWNAGIFVATPETILNEIKTQLPKLYHGLKRLEKRFDTDSFENDFEKIYYDLESISFDYGIMEKIKSPVFVIPCECGWSDVGSWESLYELKQSKLYDNNNLIEGNSLLVDCHNNFIRGKDHRLIACLGIDNCLVVDTDDALLIADLKKSQEIKKIVEQLKTEKKEESL